MRKLLVISLAMLHLWLLVNLRFEAWPEMMVMPYLQLNGFELYREMITPWTPGLMWLLRAWFGLVGLTVANLKLLTWGLILVIDVLIYRIASKRWGKRAGLPALAVFVALQPLFDGNGLWFDLATVPILLLAFHWQQPWLLGPAFLIKQSVVWLFPVSVFGRSKDEILLKLKSLILGLIVAIGGSALCFFWRGTLKDYWWWAYDFSFRVFPHMPGHRDLATWRHWALALAPFVVVFGYYLVRLANKICYSRSYLLKCWRLVDSREPVLWMLAAMFLALPRFGMFHFQPAVAFLTLAIGRSAGGIRETKSIEAKWLKSLAVGTMFVYLVICWSRVIKLQWQKPDRFLEPEVYEQSEQVKRTTLAHEPVLLVNTNELVYVLAERLPPKPWLTQFPWFLELLGFQEELIESFKKQELTQVVVTPYLTAGRFVPGSYRPELLWDYLEELKMNKER